MLKVGSIVWGVEDVPRAIAFWCAALNYKPVREPEDDWAILVPVEGAGIQLAIDKADVGPTQDRPRHHLDLYAKDQKAEAARLLSLGASEVTVNYPAGADYIVLADPDGNRFCVVQDG